MKNQNISMIDVTQKKETERLAVAVGRIKMNKSTLELIKKNQIPKGDVLVAAQIAGIMAAKRTPDTIPLCHPLLLSGVQVDFSFAKKGYFIDITASVNGKGKTGFEMEALHAVTVAALTIYDMCKMFDKGMIIEGVHLAKKSGGKSGVYEYKSKR